VVCDGFAVDGFGQRVRTGCLSGLAIGGTGRVGGAAGGISQKLGRPGIIVLDARAEFVIVLVAIADPGAVREETIRAGVPGGAPMARCPCCRLPLRQADRFADVAAFEVEATHWPFTVVGTT
jgi:hypothetical protein